jgi:hypothetical protein
MHNSNLCRYAAVGALLETPMREIADAWEGGRLPAGAYPLLTIDHLYTPQRSCFISRYH